VRAVDVAAFALLAGGCHGGPSSLPPPPDILVIEPAIEMLTLGSTGTLAAVVVSADGGRRTVAASWSSDAPEVAAIGSDGRVKGIVLGRTTIHASYQSLSAVRPLRVVPDYGGTWSGEYLLKKCTRVAGPGSSPCRFGIGATLGLRAIVTQTGFGLSGTLELYTNAPYELVESGPIEGSIDDDGALVLTGTTSSVEPEHPGETTLSGWRTTLAGGGDLMEGRFVQNRHFLNAFGWQHVRWDCEIVTLTRSR
jgi:hypothetical protein